MVVYIHLKKNTWHLQPLVQVLRSGCNSDTSSVETSQSASASTNHQCLSAWEAITQPPLQILSLWNHVSIFTAIKSNILANYVKQAQAKLNLNSWIHVTYVERETKHLKLYQLWMRGSLYFSRSAESKDVSKAARAAFLQVVSVLCRRVMRPCVT